MGACPHGNIITLRLQNWPVAFGPPSAPTAAACSATPELWILEGYPSPADLRVPTLSFAEDLTCHGTNQTARLIACGPAHSPCDAVPWLPEAGILFTGDLITDGNLVLCYGHPEAWVTVLDRLAALDPRLVVPGHGRVARAGAAIARGRAYISGLLDQAAQALAAGAGGGLGRPAACPGGVRGALVPGERPLPAEAALIKPERSNGTEMDAQQFWALIDSSRREAGGDPDQQMEVFGEMLAELPAQEILDFDRLFTEYWVGADSRDLWGAAYLIGGGCSGDGFMDFRGWLIAKGRKVYEAALADPDSLAQHMTDADDNGQIEGFQYVAAQAWAESTGRDWSEFPHTDIPFPAELSGEPFAHEELAERFPKLAAKSE